jgi:hypothetical protein
VREIRTLGLMRRGLEIDLWWRYWGTPMRKRGATDRRNLRALRQSSTLLGDERALRERSSDSIPTFSLARCVARRTAKRRQRHRWAG